MDRKPYTESMAALKNPLDVDRINIDDPSERQAFYEALIAHGAPLVREERMQAFRAGLIDEQGRVVDRSRVTDVDAKLSVEQ
jgi:hypothetical protein